MWEMIDSCGNEKVMLDWEGQRRVCACVCACVCTYEKKLRIKMGIETPRGKFLFAWLVLDNSFLEEEMGRRG